MKHTSIWRIESWYADLSIYGYIIYQGILCAKVLIFSQSYCSTDWIDCNFTDICDTAFSMMWAIWYIWTHIQIFIQYQQLININTLDMCSWSVVVETNWIVTERDSMRPFDENTTGKLVSILCMDNPLNFLWVYIISTHNHIWMDVWLCPLNMFPWPFAHKLSWVNRTFDQRPFCKVDIQSTMFERNVQQCNAAFN